MFLGICGGTAVGATDPGQTSFAPIGNSGIVPNATDALYGFGSAGSIATGINGITFFPNGFGNFDWQSF
jgi:hypothetical protein